MATTTTTSTADPPEAPMPRIVVEEPPSSSQQLQQQHMGPGAGAATALVLLVTMIWVAWDAHQRRRRQQHGGATDADRMHPARRERLEAEERERRLRQEQEARRLAALRAQRFGPPDTPATKPVRIPDTELLAGRQPFPFDSLPPTASVSIPSSSPAAVDPSAYMVCAPLETVEELWAWTAPTALASPKAFIPPYVPPPRTVQHETLRRGQLLVCHDMKGAAVLDGLGFAATS
jgi:hypothetical protein